MICAKSLQTYMLTLQLWLIASYTEINEYFKHDGIEHFFLVIYAAALVTNRFFAACVQLYM